MPLIRPFRGLRYNATLVGHISKVVAPPYDIIYDEWREKLYARHPNNIVRLVKTKEEPGDTETHNKYIRAKNYIDTWMREDILRFEEKPAIYVRSETYTINGETKTRYGFIALNKIENYGGRVHAHEKTLSAPKVDRMKLIKTTGTNLSQIFAIFNDPESEIQNILLNAAKSTPDVDFMDEQDIVRKMWKMDDMMTITHLQNIMKDRNIVIADGHHRYETSLEYKEYMEPTRKNPVEPFDYVSMYFSGVDAHGMSILPTHRKVGGLKTFDEKVFFLELSNKFDITYYNTGSLGEILSHIKKDSEKTNIFGISTVNGFSLARLKEPNVPKDLDVEILHNEIIENILGISPDDIANGRYLHFCKSPEHAYEDVARGKDQISFYMNAVTPEELFRVVLNGRRMPQKSTYFYPKTLSGLVMYKIDRESLGS